jgi:hypothetical protein
VYSTAGLPASLQGEEELMARTFRVYNPPKEEIKANLKWTIVGPI